MKDLSNLSFEDFRTMALDGSLSKYEKIGFPDAYRAGKEGLIFDDIRGKLPALDQHGRRILDIGPGCSDLPHMLITLCAANNHALCLIDSGEMLTQLPQGEAIHKIEGRFPNDVMSELANLTSGFDAIIAYSMLHYVLPGNDIFAFLDAALGLLAPGGHLLVGDVPNASKRKRFLASPSGLAFHEKNFGDKPRPSVAFNALEPNRIDDAVVLGLLMRARAAGFDGYVVPQNAHLPMANRREDLVFVRP